MNTSLRYCSVFFILLLSFSGCDESSEELCENYQNALSEGKGKSCESSSDCPSIPCPCSDGSVVNIQTCGNQICVDSCEESCSEILECSTPKSESKTFDCNGTTCNSDQYCLISKSGDTVATTDCVDTTCTTCDCANEDAPKQFPTSNNCSGIIFCATSGSHIKIECTVPRTF